MAVVFFSPNGDAESTLTSYIGNCNYGAKCMAYIYQSEPIHQALIYLAEGSLDVRVLLDKGQQFLQSPRIDALRAAGALVLFDKVEKRQAASYCILDDSYVFSGSYQYTPQSDTKYHSDMLAFFDEEHATPYLGDWDYHWAHGVYQ